MMEPHACSMHTDITAFSSGGSLFDTTPINPVLDATLSARLGNIK